MSSFSKGPTSSVLIPTSAGRRVREWARRVLRAARPLHEPAPPVRAELFSLERLEQHADSLAATVRLIRKPSRGRPLISRVKANGRVLAACYREISSAARDERWVTPAAEWLIENFPVVEEQIREVLEDLPPGFYWELPKLADGPLARYPRIFGLAWAFVAHTDSRIDPDWLRRFIQAFQRTDPLLIGEVWALPINLRVVLIENLRRLAERITSAKAAQKRADALADRILGAKGQPPADLEDALLPFEGEPLPRAFSVQLVQRLREQGGGAPAVLQWLDARLAAQGAAAEEIVRLEHQEEAALNTTVRNVITSMRLLSSLDWPTFFEETSDVDRLLRSDGRFAAMDFATRDMYRHAVEDLSRGSGLSEREVAQRALRAASTAAAGPLDAPADLLRRKDPGYYLVSKGRPAFERELRVRAPLRRALSRLWGRCSAPLYLGSIAAGTAFLLSLPLADMRVLGAGWLALAAWGALALLPASDLAVALVNRLVTEAFAPKLLPKLDYSAGIPPESPTLVVMPVLLTGADGVEELLERLEIHYLSNPDGHIHFALLSDWKDALQESLPEDGALLDAALRGIARLNERYGPGPEGRARFLLLHRRRLWNPQEGAWMGWERKRGKLHELNAWLRGDARTTFLPGLPEAAAVLPHIAFVVTLDADTRMSRGGAYRLAGAMAHPLNRPRFDPASGRVVEGYGVMQPRVTPTLPFTGGGTLHQSLFSGPAGIDPYAFAVSDVYQDLFEEGSYVGKGIYDVDVFEAAMKGRVPENAMLSHDLFEGVHARTALVTDIEFFEEFPPHDAVARARNHRWMRGDWQLLPWIFGRGASPAARPGDRLPPIARWKMLDNLRRSLSAPAAFLALSWGLISTAPWAGRWLLFVLATQWAPPLFPGLFDLLRGPRSSWAAHLRNLGEDFRLGFVHALLSTVFLARQAALSSDAILRTLYRLAVSRRRLLQWVSAAQVGSDFLGKVVDLSGHTRTTPLLAAVLTTLVWASGAPRPWPALVPFLMLWLLAPWVSRRLDGLADRGAAPPPTPEERRAFRRIARKTWRYFETFVDAEHHFLPPDNFQEVPRPVVAGRTSPTNIGLYLLSVTAAWDFGWLGAAEMADRLEATLATLQRLQKHKGHLFNWYDTRDLRPLDPPYISTVDSGNLAGHLWAVANACRERASGPSPRTDVFAGLEDAFLLVEEAARDLADERRAGTVTGAQLRDALESLRTGLREAARPADEARLAGFRRSAEVLVDVARTLAAHDPGGKEEQDLLAWSELLLRQVDGHGRDLREDPAVLAARFSALARRCERTVEEMKFGFLFDPVKKLFAIGFRAADQKLDPGHYDLLASEARLASFVAIAKGDVPTSHWFRLVRSFALAGRDAVLLSWSGSMFEYLMPSLVMRSPAGGLLERTCRGVVRRQIAYGRERGVPWGVSESAYNVQDIDFAYQYSNFGVPGLGLKRGLSDDLLVSPYATALAAMFAPSDAAANFARLSAAGAEGRYGYYEALDYTPARLPEGGDVAVVRAYMAHHQGMSLTALGNVLTAGAPRARFHAEPMVRATELLLQERMPRDARAVRVRAEEVHGEVRAFVPPVLRRFTSPHDAPPKVHLLSNGSYSVLLTAAGSGYSRWRDLAVTRWREDGARDPWGSYVYLRDVESGAVWSAGYQPTAAEPDAYEVDFSDERSEIVRRDGSLRTTLEVVVSPEDDAEIRRVTVKNLGDRPRVVELTSYAEVVLAPPAADRAHPAFSNLFVRTEFVPEVNGLFFTRRPRSAGDPTPWAGHVLVVEGDALGPVEYETDRARFLGRGRDASAPLCVTDGKPLSDTTGAVLDPVMSLRRRVRVAPGASVHAAFSTFAAPSREALLVLADKYHDPAMFERAVTLAWTQERIQRHHLRMATGEAHVFQELAGRVLHAHGALRAPSDVLKRNALGAPGLWAHGISGDLPIVLLRIDDPGDRDIVRELLRAHAYWRMKGLDADLVVLIENAHSYMQELQNAVNALVRAGEAAFHPKDVRSPRGRVFVLRADILSPEHRLLLLAAARAILLSRHGPLASQLDRLADGPAEGSFRASCPLLSEPGAGPRRDAPELQFFNGLGGFSPDGREYVTRLGPGQWTPAPWINVVANPAFGFQVSESGAGATWALNSRENRLTPWSNDPVSDPAGEVFYVRDEESGEVWTPTALPIREESGLYVARHGQGYSRFERAARGVSLDLLQFVPMEDPVKISRLTLTNHSPRPRRLSVTAYVEWVLGVAREASAPNITTEREEGTNALLAWNPWNTPFAGRVAFADMGGAQTSWTGDRSSFLGRNGSLASPAAMAPGRELSDAFGAGLDPCAAMRRVVRLPPGTSVTVDFFLGQAGDRAGALDLVRRVRSMDLDARLREVERAWDSVLSAVQVRTPDRALDLMLNRWLLYQTLACRLWARSGFYQGGGAYGFRDQLQDVMALAVSRPALAREHILRAAARQFPEGDVQHWWHPPTGAGVRTRISDDVAWLAHATLHYLEVTGDASLLDERVPFLNGPPLAPEAHDAYFTPSVAEEDAPLYEHCARALDRALAVGPHGLPLMGGGDWNDGMNRVGHEGRGESVWLAWFLHTTLWEFAKVAEKRGDALRAETWRLHVGDLKAAVERSGWDGDWYRRAYFDDGTPLGSASNAECRIDSIAQSWGVISGAADPARAMRAMAALDQHLVKRGEGLVLLLTPPFDGTRPDPGYIQGYLPGVRENGGQYTHAAAWAVIAFAALGDGDKAGELLSLLNPIRHGSTRADIHRYKVEPYVAAGDVYGAAPHMGRGGWTWYTGSAGWLYRAGAEWVLGFRLRGATFLMDPCIPRSWPGFELSFRYHASRYEVKVENPRGVSRGIHSADVDGAPVRAGAPILLKNDGAVHTVRLILG